MKLLQIRTSWAERAFTAAGWALFLLLLSASWAYSQEEEDFSAGPTDLTGVVLDEVGQPVAGAHVFVESARPRHGSRSVCPTCYPDCAKTARTNDKGEFTLPAMDSNLLFRLLLVAKGYEASALDKVDPLLSPVSCSLWTRAPAEEGEKVMNVRVYDPKGKPAMGAVLDIEGAETARMTTWGGHKQFIQDVGVADERGVMTLIGNAELKAGLGILKARNFAQQWVKVLPGKDQIFILREGVTLTGQVVKEGKPVPGLRVSFAGADRMAGEFLQGWEVETDAEGRFRFLHLTAGKQFNVYSVAKSSANIGVFPIRAVHTGPDGSETDLGMITLQTPLHVRGKVILADGEPALPGMRIGLGREQAWDYQEATLGDDGEFEFNGLGPETVDISLRAQGYKFSKRNPNRVMNRSIAGRLQESLDNFLIIVEELEGVDDPNDFQDHNWNVREQPLRSAER